MIVWKSFLSYFVIITLSFEIILANNEGFLKKLNDDEIAEADCICENGHCEKDASGKEKCVCPPEYGLFTPQKCKECGCGRGANCTVTKGWFSDQIDCICPEGIKKKADRRCEDPCESNPCKNGGTCQIDYRGMTCQCPPSYTGNTCEAKCDCENGRCILDKSGGIQCVCLPEFGLYKGKCQACECGKGANCTFEGIWIVMDKYCICPNGEKRRNKPCEVNTIPPTFETSAFPLEFNQTTEESNNVTNDYKQTTHEQLNYTSGFNQTNSVTFNTTSDFRETTYNSTEPSYSTTQSVITSRTTVSGCDCGIKSIACKFDEYGNKRCWCRHGFSQLEDTCTDCYCGEHSITCFFDIYGDKRCVCKEGYSQRNGTCSAICRSDADCWNGGTCRIDSNGYTFCVCVTGFTGDKCELDSKCQYLEETCQKFYAVCKIIKGKPTCECPPDKSFRLSSGLCENICDWNTCIHGQCEERGQRYVCRCYKGYTGTKCDTKITSISKKQVVLYILISSLFVIFILAISMTVALKCRKRLK